MLRVLTVLLLLSASRAIGVESEFNMTSLNMYETATNRNFKILLNDQPVFLRVGRENPEQIGIDRATEIAHYKVAESLGIAPKLLAYQIANGMLVTEFIEGVSPSDQRVHEPEFLENITSALRLLHSCQPTELGCKKSVFVKNDRLLEAFSQPKKIARWLTMRTSFEPNYYAGIAEGICHGDLFRGNLLETADGTLYLIDWEYSYYGPVIDDIGKLCAANWLSDEEIRHIAHLYWETDSGALFRKVKENIFMQQLNLYLWCHIQAHAQPQMADSYLWLAHRAERHLDQLMGELQRL